MCDSQIANPLGLGVRLEALPARVDVPANQNEEFRATWLCQADALPGSDSDKKENEVRPIKDMSMIYGPGIGFIPRDTFMAIRELDFTVHIFSAV